MKLCSYCSHEATKENYALTPTGKFEISDRTCDDCAIALDPSHVHFKLSTNLMLSARHEEQLARRHIVELRSILRPVLEQSRRFAISLDSCTRFMDRRAGFPVR
jgi:hypothetical protein